MASLNRDWKYLAIGAALKTMSLLRLDSLAGDRFRGEGVILTFHQVRPVSDRNVDLNRLLEITPTFLETVLRILRTHSYDIIPIEELSARLANPRPGRRFAVLTFDDGYRDTLEYALPVLHRFDAPICMYVCPGFLDRTTPLWWLDLEDAVFALDAISLDLPDGPFRENASNEREKRNAFKKLYWRLRSLDEPALRIIVAELAAKAGIDTRARIDQLCLDWEELRFFARDPLVTIGAHTMTHPRLGTLPEPDARREMLESKSVLEAKLGKAVNHFSYPVGDKRAASEREFAMARELGFHSAVTTRPGMITRDHGARMHSLPRLSVNGLFQQSRAFETLLSGVPFALKREESV